MIKKMAWNTFKQTGNIDTFLEFTQIKNLEENILGESDEENKNKRDNNCRK